MFEKLQSLGQKVSSERSSNVFLSLKLISESL